MNGIKPFEVEVDRTSCEVHAKGEAFKLTLKGVMLWKPLICKMANAAKGERRWLEGGVRVVRTKTRYSSAVEVPLERGQRFILSESYHTAQRTPGFRRSSQNFSEYLPPSLPSSSPLCHPLGGVEAVVLAFTRNCRHSPSFFATAEGLTPPPPSFA